MDFEVLHVLSFDSTRKRMSVIVRHPLTKEIILYTKGADSAILSVLAKKYKGNVIVRHPLIKEIILYTKGADSAILSVLAKKYKGKVIFVIYLLKKLSCTLKVLTRRFSVCLPRNIKVM